MGRDVASLHREVLRAALSALAWCALPSALAAVEVEETFPAADWRGEVARVVRASMDEAFPRTVVFGGRNEPEVFTVRIAGTAAQPQPRARGHITMGLSFTEGNYGWGYRTWVDLSKPGRQEATLTVFPERPIYGAYVYYGAPANCGAKMEAPEFTFYRPAGDAILDGMPVTNPGRFRKAGFLVRDAAAMGGYSAIGPDAPAKGLALDCTQKWRDGARFVSARLKGVEGGDRAVTLVYAVELPPGEIVWWDDARRRRLADPSRRCELNNVLGGECARGGLSRYPIGAVTVGGRGIAIGIDPEVPGFFRIAVNPRLRLLYIAYDIGLAVPERNYGDVALTVFGFSGEEGFRGAYDAYRRLYPKSHEARVKKHGIWSAFEPIHKIKDPDDFHFRFNEYMYDAAFDDAHGILSLRYKEPCTWWMKLTGESGRLPTYAECLAKAQDELRKGVPDARAWATSVFRDESGDPAGMILDKPWCKGIAWSMNAAPGIKGEMTEYTFKQSETDFQANYGKTEYPEGRDGEYVDSSELACTLAADFDRRHFAGMKAPLTFSQDRFLPCVHKGLCVWDYSQDIARRLRARGRVLFANATPNKWSFLTPQMDAVGLEIDWLPGGKWKPSPEEDLLYWRTVAGDKPYCFLMTNRKNFSYGATERYMKLCLAYAFMPGFQPNYFFTLGYHERDRALFRKYLPTICRLSEAGWRPVNRLASTETAGMRVEQFGDRFITAINHGKDAGTAAVRFAAPGVAVTDMLTGRRVETAGGIANIPLAPGESVALELAKDGS